MLNRILLLILCTNLHATTQPEDTNSAKIIVAAGAISLGAAALALYSLSIADTASNLTTDDIIKCAKAGITIVGATAGAFATTKLYPIGKEICELIFPTEDQRALQNAKVLASQNKLNLLKAEEQFRNCLLSCNANSQRNAAGVPTICEEAAQMLSKLGAQNEVDRMNRIFNKYTGKEC